MNTFVGSITYKAEIDTDNLEYSHIVNATDDLTTLFIFGDTKCESSKDIVEELSKTLSVEFVSYDISIQTEDEISMLNIQSGEEGLYECVSFEGIAIEFKDIVSRFTDSFEVVSVREAETSKKFGNRIIKVDFIY